MGRLTVVVGGQYGSEGKGAVTAHLARRLERRDLNIRVAGPNAGHTGYDLFDPEHPRKWALRQVPIGAVTSFCGLGIAAGSEIDPEVLADEVQALDQAGYDVSGRLWVHPSATMISANHKRQEASAHLISRVGSTGKGIGAARAARIMRVAKTFGEEGDHRDYMSSRFIDLQVTWPTESLARHRDILIEGTQGYGLGLRGEHYPQTTSSDCRAVDFLSMAGISPWDSHVTDTRVWVVARVFPIRVAGNSGPLKGETTWDHLGLPEERTTVTQKVRRVGEWDSDLVRQAVAANGGAPAATIALTMLDQLFPELAGAKTVGKILGHPLAVDFIRSVEYDCQARVGMVGTSPTSLVELPQGWNA